MSAMFCTRCLRAALPRRQVQMAPLARTFTTALPLRSAEPKLSTPTTAPGEQSPSQEPAAPRSICVEGTILTGLNYQKDGKDPVALKDEEYPEWLWDCLEVTQKKTGGEEDFGDEFSKSKKERKAAMKKRRAMEAKLLAEGNMDALRPKIPLHEQSIDLPGDANASVEHNTKAAKARGDLKKAMRMARKAKIKERNYLQSM